MELFDEESQCPYYENLRTRRTQWEKPAGFVSFVPYPASSPRLAEAKTRLEESKILGHVESALPSSASRRKTADADAAPFQREGCKDIDQDPVGVDDESPDKPKAANSPVAVSHWSEEKRNTALELQQEIASNECAIDGQLSKKYKRKKKKKKKKARTSSTEQEQRLQTSKEIDSPTEIGEVHGKKRRSRSKKQKDDKNDLGKRRQHKQKYDIPGVHLQASTAAMEAVPDLSSPPNETKEAAEASPSTQSPAVLEPDANSDSDHIDTDSGTVREIDEPLSADIINTSSETSHDAPQSLARDAKLDPGIPASVSHERQKYQQSANYKCRDKPHCHRSDVTVSSTKPWVSRRMLPNGVSFYSHTQTKLTQYQILNCMSPHILIYAWKDFKIHTRISACAPNDPAAIFLFHKRPHELAWCSTGVPCMASLFERVLI